MAFLRRSPRLIAKTAIFSQGLPPRRESSIASISTSMIQPSTSPPFPSAHQMLATTAGPPPPKATLKKIAILSPSISEELSKPSSTPAKLKSPSFRAGRWSRLSKGAKTIATWQGLMASIAKSECLSQKKSPQSPTLPTKKMTNSLVTADRSTGGLLSTLEAKSTSMILLLQGTTSTKAQPLASRLIKWRSNL